MVGAYEPRHRCDEPRILGVLLVAIGARPWEDRKPSARPGGVTAHAPMNGARKELLMEAVSTRARFGDLAPGAETRRIEATVSRREIEEVLRAEGQPELLLDVRLSGDGRAETRRVAVEWERADLEKLLKDARAERVNLGIDIDSLIRALEGPEVEAHGLREKALVLTVAL